MAKIFLSSTLIDLKPYREAAIAALRKAGHEVDAMEDFPAEDAQPLQVCKNRVRECDLYVGIIAWRYGTVNEEFGKSVTEIEYWTAYENSLDCLFFLISAEQAWVPKYIDSDSKQKALLESFKKHVLENHTVDFFTTPDNLANKIGSAVSFWDKNQSLANTLNTIYPPSTFHILRESEPHTDRQVSVYAAKFLLSAIEKDMEKNHRIVLGLAGGPLTLQIVEELSNLLTGITQGLIDWRARKTVEIS